MTHREQMYQGEREQEQEQAENRKKEEKNTPPPKKKKEFPHCGFKMDFSGRTGGNIIEH